MTPTTTPQWVKVCRLASLPPERGVAALVGVTQVAIFRTFDGALYALDNIDPFTSAAVLSRGIVGTRGPIPTVASPLLKQVFSLETGQCLDDETVRVPTYRVRTVDDEVELEFFAAG